METSSESGASSNAEGETQANKKSKMYVATTVLLPKAHRYASPTSKFDPYTTTNVLPDTGPLVGQKEDTRAGAE